MKRRLELIVRHFHSIYCVNTADVELLSAALTTIPSPCIDFSEIVFLIDSPSGFFGSKGEGCRITSNALGARVAL